MRRSFRSLPVNIESQVIEEEYLLNAIFSFNVNPSEGIHALCNVRNIPETPENIAHLLRKEQGLLGPKVASYLNSNPGVLHAYFHSFNLKKPFIESMREAFSDSLDLQGEAEFIDNVLSVFAQVYCFQNPDMFPSVDSAYMLAFALILLNSDLHNPNMKNHMTCIQFINNIRSVVTEATISDNELSEIYREIKSKPFTVRNGDGNFLALSDPKLKGFLWKRNDRWNSTWTSRFFVLANSCIYYFLDNKAENKDRPLGMVQLIAVEASADPKNNKRFSIESKDSDIQYVKYRPTGPFLSKGVRRIEFEASSEEARDKWLYRINKSMICSYFADASCNPQSRPEQSEISEIPISSDEHTEPPAD
ncbi:Cytohesin-1 [Tritrichomonas foetus]|uniref:Cytohesin-1 n=1 Tax=Tritrichomonas foetus TaxID=1144522 RepID=A0A1J4KW99_9EUKA|nr:Cytohesin-1 [Tritrichomonas foetus]|eukprot:OHT15168.1 Cytohesin-1 [Tritrichomonas foetus]